MARLKSRTRGIPFKFQFHQPQTGFTTANDSFDVVVHQVIANRKGNAFIAQQNNLSTDPKIVELEVDDFNAKRMLAHKGWEHFAYPDTGGPSPNWLAGLRTPLRNLAQGAAAGVSAVRRTASGVRLVSDWLGAALRPVDHELAEQRAKVCVSCPSNGDPNWLETVTGEIAAEIKTLIEVKHDLRLSTSVDDKLHTCKICTCFNKLKVHTPIEHILKTMADDVKKALAEVKIPGNKRCWVIEEGEKLK